MSKERLILKISSWEVRTTEFANKSQKPSANSTEKNVKHCRGLYRTFNNLEMFMATTLNAATFMGKNFSIMQKCCEESRKSYVETNV